MPRDLLGFQGRCSGIEQSHIACCPSEHFDNITPNSLRCHAQSKRFDPYHYVHAPNTLVPHADVKDDSLLKDSFIAIGMHVSTSHGVIDALRMQLTWRTL